MRKNQLIQKMLHKSGLYFRKYSPMTLSCVASVGVIVTAVEAVKDTPKALSLVMEDSRKNHDGDPYAYTKKEAIASAWKCYIPAAAFGVSTIACIMSANVKLQAKIKEFDSDAGVFRLDPVLMESR